MQINSSYEAGIIYLCIFGISVYLYLYRIIACPHIEHICISIVNNNDNDNKGYNNIIIIVTLVSDHMWWCFTDYIKIPSLYTNCSIIQLDIIWNMTQCVCCYISTYFTRLFDNT